FVEFGFPFIINAFSFQKNMKALLMNGNSFVEFGFPLAGKPFKILAWATGNPLRVSLLATVAMQLVSATTYKQLAMSN
ncbi:MAG TPA: hypothetical protein DD379_04540, partial [Cyanobacteria bacterium UBA11162]|nr:hypothetical protein [Cyanobacteria bacterium UBA11162]